MTEPIIGVTYCPHSGQLRDIYSSLKLLNANAIQIVISNSRGTFFLPTDDDINVRLENMDIYMVAHGMYTINLCNRGSQFSFNKRELIKQIHICEQLNCNIIIHQGKNTQKLPLQNAMKLYVDAITEIIRDSKTEMTQILLENSSHAGTEMGYNIAQLEQIYNMFPSDIKDRIGFCLDTCHAFVAGELDLRNLDSIKKFIYNFDRSIGISNLHVIHLNDSKSPFGSHSDRHSSWMFGHITNQHLPNTNTKGLLYFMLIMFANNIPMIMETDSDKYKWDVAFTKNVICSHQLKKATDNIEKMFALQSDHAKTFALTLSK
jgi:deoxyribonuclease IV